MRMHVAYLVSRYPAVSHTFIQREIAALRERGVDVTTVSIRAASAADALSDADRRERAATIALLPPSFATLAGAAIAAASHPRAWAAVTRYALGRGRGHPRATLWQLFYAVEALLLWRELRRRGLRHVHVHFANVGADVARLTCRFGNAVGGGPWTWSFTMHGPTEFADIGRFDLAEKVVDADAVMCISDFCRSQLMALVTEDHWSKLAIVHAGIDPSAFPRVERPAPRPDTLHVLCVGRLVPEKGQAVLLEALRRLTDDGLEIAVTLVGDGPRRVALEKLAAELGVADRTRFTGAVSQDDIRAYYERADVFCLPSFAEGVPVVLMEAMATGLPVVTTRIAGIPELVQDDVSGVLVPPGRADLLAGALAALAAAPERHRSMGEAGRQAVVDRYDIASAAAEVVAVLERTTQAT